MSPTCKSPRLHKMFRATLREGLRHRWRWTSVHVVYFRSRKAQSALAQHWLTLGADAVRRTWLCAIASVAIAHSAVAQTDWQLESALSRIRAAGSLYTTAASLSAFARQQIGVVAPMLRGDATVTSDSVAAVQLLMGVNILPPWTSRAPVDL